jgi:RimJ/RimL family protein N-acetyltransferase
MKINFRKINDDDFPFLRKLYRSTREDELSLSNMTEEEKQKFIDFQFNAQHTYYKSAYASAELKIILLNNSPVGRLYLWRTENQIRIMDISLLPGFCGKGIGTKILKSLIRESEESQKKLNIHVEYYNPALKLYKRLGFQKTDDTGVYYFMERTPQNK